MALLSLLRSLPRVRCQPRGQNSLTLFFLISPTYKVALNNASVCFGPLIEYSNLRHQDPMNILVTTHLAYVLCVFVVIKMLNSFIALLNYSSPISSAAKPISK